MAGVACGVGDVLVLTPPVDVALSTMGEVVEAIDGDDDCVGPEEDLIASFVG